MHDREFALPEHVRPYSVNFNKQPRIKFVNPNVDNYKRNIEHASDLHRNHGYSMIQKDMLKGKAAVICGSGNTLGDEDVLDAIRKKQENGALLVACKQAIKFLHDKGFKIDYAVSMDPGAHIACPEKIYKAPGVKHIIASSSDPELFDYLKGEEVLIFHSACGVENEVKLYQDLFDNPDCMGGGYNVINRALSAFLYMGCLPITLAGVDSGWRAGQSFYVDGTNNRPGVDMCDNGRVEMTQAEQTLYRALSEKVANKQDLTDEEVALLGNLQSKVWHTRPDMLASAVALAQVAKQYSEQDFEILGKVLPHSLRYKDEAFLKECVSFQ